MQCHVDGNREPKTHRNRFETPPNAIETQVKGGERDLIKSTYLPSSVYNLCFYGIRRRFKYEEENREPKTHRNRFETPLNAIETQVIHRRWEGKSFLLNLFPLL